MKRILVSCIGLSLLSACQISRVGQVVGCEAVPVQELRDECYLNKAFEKKDMSLCEKISGPAIPGATIKGQCRSVIAVALQDLSLCDTLPDERGNFGTYSCYAQIGAEKHDYGICYKIPEDKEDLRDRCIQDVARRKGECEVISNQAWKDYCYLYQSNSIEISVRDNRCDVYKEQKLADVCVNLLQQKITVEDMCAPISDPKLKTECLSYDLDHVQVNYDDK